MANQEALPIQLQHPENGKIDPEAPAPQESGAAILLLAQQSAQITEAAQQLENQQQADKDAMSNGNEPSRRIEITRDLVGDKLAAAKAA